MGDETIRALDEAVSQEEKGKSDPASRWVQRMIRSAKQYHKLCPYYDKKTMQCFLQLGGKCDRDGKFETCPVFADFLYKKYQEYKEKKRPLPMDFLDISLA